MYGAELYQLLASNHGFSIMTQTTCWILVGVAGAGTGWGCAGAAVDCRDDDDDGDDGGDGDGDDGGDRGDGGDDVGPCDDGGECHGRRPGGGRASNESSHCQAAPRSRVVSLASSLALRFDALQHWNVDVGPIASPAEPAPPTASRQSLPASTGYFNVVSKHARRWTTVLGPLCRRLRGELTVCPGLSPLLRSKAATDSPLRMRHPQRVPPPIIRGQQDVIARHERRASERNLAGRRRPGRRDGRGAWTLARPLPLSVASACPTAKGFNAPHVPSPTRRLIDFSIQVARLRMSASATLRGSCLARVPLFLCFLWKQEPVDCRWDRPGTPLL